MSDDSKDKKFLLRLTQELYEQVAQQAQSENRSVNAYIINFLSKNIEKTSFENRQIVGKRVTQKQIFTDSGLIEISGIYYRYLVDDNQEVDIKSDYIITQASGNILTLTKI